MIHPSSNRDIWMLMLKGERLLSLMCQHRMMKGFGNLPFSIIVHL
jgi:hypothetical protein